MTQEEIKEIERVFQKPILEVDELNIPAYIRQKDEKAEIEEAQKTESQMWAEEKLSVCCHTSLIGGIQCETCGADGRKFAEE